MGLMAQRRRVRGAARSEAKEDLNQPHSAAEQNSTRTEDLRSPGENEHCIVLLRSEEIAAS